MSKPNKLKQLIREKTPVAGISLVLGDPQIAEEAARSGIDYVYIDLQHGLMDDRASLIAMLRATATSSVTPLVRVPTNDADAIGSALDAGAHGVIVPMVNSVEDARRAAHSCRYHPRGQRSWGPFRTEFGLGADPDVVNDNVLCIVMIETAMGVEAADDIAAVDGVDGVYLGPADLSVSLGFPPRYIEHIDDAAPLAAVAKVREAFLRRGKVAGLSGDYSVRTAEGFGLVTIGSDLGLVRAGLAALTGTLPNSSQNNQRT